MPSGKPPLESTGLLRTTRITNGAVSEEACAIHAAPPQGRFGAQGSAWIEWMGCILLLLAEIKVDNRVLLRSRNDACGVCRVLGNDRTRHDCRRWRRGGRTRRRRRARRRDVIANDEIRRGAKGLG